MYYILKVQMTLWYLFGRFWKEKEAPSRRSHKKQSAWVVEIAEKDQTLAAIREEEVDGSIIIFQTIRATEYFHPYPGVDLFLRYKTNIINIVVRVLRSARRQLISSWNKLNPLQTHSLARSMVIFLWRNCLIYMQA